MKFFSYIYIYIYIYKIYIVIHTNNIKLLNYIYTHTHIHTYIPNFLDIVLRQITVMFNEQYWITLLRYNKILIQACTLQHYFTHMHSNNIYCVFFVQIHYTHRFLIPTYCAIFIFIVSALTCIGNEFSPSSGSYKILRRTQRIWLLIIRKFYVKILL